MGITSLTGSLNRATDFMVEQAIRETLDIYGDNVSVLAKKKSLHKFGRNSVVGSTVQCTLMELAGTETEETYVSTNIIDSVSSDNNSNTMEITVEGHTISGSDFTFVSQTITVTGQAEATLTTPLARVSRAFVSGTTPMQASSKIFIYDNTGVTLSSGTPSIASQVHLILSSDDNQSLKAATTFSSVDYFFLGGVFAGVNKKTSAAVDVRLQVRRSGGVFRTIHEVIALDNAATTGLYIPITPFIVVPKNADIRMTAIADTTGVEVVGSFDGYLASVV